MDHNFKEAFEKVAGLAKEVGMNFFHSGENYAKHIAAKRAAHAAQRSAVKKAITKSYGGTVEQAGKMRVSPHKKPLIGGDKFAPSVADTAKSKQIGLKLTPNSTWKKALNS